MRTRLQAEATATGQGIALQRMLVEKMPEIIGAAASQLANANVTVLNGADGMGQLLAGLAGQASQLMKLVQNGVNLNGQSALPGGDAVADAKPERHAGLSINPGAGRVAASSMIRRRLPGGGDHSSRGEAGDGQELSEPNWLRPSPRLRLVRRGQLVVATLPVPRRRGRGRGRRQRRGGGHRGGDRRSGASPVSSTSSSAAEFGPGATPSGTTICWYGGGS